MKFLFSVYLGCCWDTTARHSWCSEWPWPGSWGMRETVEEFLINSWEPQQVGPLVYLYVGSFELEATLTGLVWSNIYWICRFIKLTFRLILVKSFVQYKPHLYNYIEVKLMDLEILYYTFTSWYQSTGSAIALPQAASVAQLDAPSDWRPGGCGLNPRWGRQHSFMEIDHETFSTVIFSLPLIQEGQLSVSGERMCTILRGLSLPSKHVVRWTDRSRHDPIGLSGP